MKFSNRKFSLFFGACLACSAFGAASSMAGIIWLDDKLGFTVTRLILLGIYTAIVVYFSLIYYMTDHKKETHPSEFKQLAKNQLTILSNKHFMLATGNFIFILFFNSIFVTLCARTYLNLLFDNSKTTNINIISIAFLLLGLTPFILGSLYNKFRLPATILCVQSGVVLLGFSCLMLFPLSWLDQWLVYAIILVCEAFIGISIVSTSSYSLNLFPKEMSGSVSALLSTLNRLCAGVVIYVFGLILNVEDRGVKSFSMADYKRSFVLIIVMLIIAAVCAFTLYVKDKKQAVA